MAKRMIAVSGSFLMGLALTVGLLYLLAAPAASAQPDRPTAGCIPINSDIQVDTIWDQDCYQVMTSTVTVLPTATLTLAPSPGGMRIQFDASAQLQVLGNFKGLGQPDRPITFTSNTATPQPCDWVGLIFDDTGTGDTLNYSIVEYARVGLKLNGSRGVTVTHSVFRLNGCGGALDGAITGDTDYSLLFDNVIYSSTTGILLNESGSNQIISNTIYGIPQYGLRFLLGGVGGGGDNLIRDNVIHHAISGALRLEDGARNRVFNNVLYLNPGGAVDLQLQLQTMLRYNTIYSNGGSSGYVAAVQVGNSSIISDMIGNVIHDAVGDALHLAAGNSSLHPVTLNALCASGYEVHNNNVLTLEAPSNWWGVNTPVSGSQFLGPVNAATPITLGWITATNQLPADGQSSAVITITLRDALGNTVPRPPDRTITPAVPNARRINLVTTGGVLSPTTVIVDDQGVATTTLTSASSIGTALLTAQAFCGFTITAPIEFVATDVAITKTTALTSAIVGDVIPYTITYSNLSNVPATGVIITDTLPPTLHYVSSTLPCPACVPGATGLLTWTVGDLPANTTRDFVLNVSSVSAPANCGVTVTNTVTIGTLTDEVTRTNNTSTSPAVTLLCTDLAITKTPVVTSVVVGAVIPYTITYTNLTGVPASGAVITDMLPSTLRYVSDTSGLACPACVPGSTGPLIWTVGHVAANTTLSFVLNTTSAPNLATCGIPVTNAAAIGSVTSDRDLTNNVFTSSPVTLACPDLAIAKTTAVTTTLLGSPLPYTITYRNLSAVPVNGVIITDTLPPALRYVTDNSGLNCPSCVAGAGGTLTWTVGTLAANATVSFALNTTSVLTPANCAIAVTNTAAIGSFLSDANPADNVSVTGPVTLACLDLALTKSVRQSQGLASEPISYTLTYTNLSAVTATGVVITDQLPAQTIYVSDTSGIIPAITDSFITWTLPPVAPGASASFTLIAQYTGIDCTVPLTNTAGITSPWYDPNLANNQSGAVAYQLQCGRDAVVIKDDDVGPSTVALSLLNPNKQAALRALLTRPDRPTAHRDFVYEGDVVTYTIAVVNTGVLTITDFTLTETLPLYSSYLGTGWTQVNSRTFTLPVGQLGPGAGRIYYFVVRVQNPFPAGETEIINRVCGFGREADGHPDDNCSYEDTPVRPHPLRVSKSAPFCISPGERFDYTIAYASTLTGTLTNVHVTDTLPFGVAYTAGAWTCTGAVCGLTIPTIGPGQQGSLPLPVQLNPSFPYTTEHTLTNTVEIDGGSFYVLTSTVDMGADLSVVKNDNVGPMSREQQALWEALRRQVSGVSRSPELTYRDVVSPGDYITYTILYLNNGIQTARNVIITETLPLYTQYVSGGWTHVSGRLYTIALGDVPPHQGGQLTFIVKIDNPFPMYVHQIINRVDISGLDSECDWSNNVSADQTPIEGGTLPAIAYLPIIMNSNYVPPLKVKFSADNYTVRENEGPATINVVLNRASSQTVTVQYATSDLTAQAGIDYVATSGTLTFPPNKTSRSFTVTLIDDEVHEPDEQVRLTLSNPTVAQLGSPNPATLTIANDDPYCPPGAVCLKTPYSPMGLAYDPATDRLFIAHRDGPDGGSVRVMRVAVSQTLKLISPVLSAQGVAFDVARNRIYAVGWDWLTFFDGVTYLPITQVNLGNDFQAHAVAYNPATSKIYVTGYNGNAVVVVDAVTGQILTRLNSDFREPSYVAVNPVTNKVYVSNHNKGNPTGWVTVIDGASDVVIKRVYFGADLYGLTVDSSTNMIYVTSIGVKRVYAISGVGDVAAGSFDIWDSYTHKQLPLRMVAATSVTTTTRLWLTSAGSDDQGRDQLLDVRGTWPILSAVCSTPLAASPERGLLYDATTAQVFAASAASNVVTVLPEPVTRCAAATNRYVLRVIGR